MIEHRDVLNLPEDALYKLLHWFSPSFPIGSYSYSRGLETAIEAKLVLEVNGLVDWIHTDLLRGPGWTDAILFCHIFRSIIGSNQNEFMELATLANAARGSSELALESSNQGKAFAKATSECWSVPQMNSIERDLTNLGIEMTLPVAAATACALSQIPLKPALFFYTQADANNLVSAGIRLIPLGQSDGQRALSQLEQTVNMVVEKALAMDLDKLGTSTPMIDLMSMHHEIQYTRLFRS